MTLGPLIGLIGGQHEAVADVCEFHCDEQREKRKSGIYCAACPTRKYPHGERHESRFLTMNNVSGLKGDNEQLS